MIDYRRITEINDQLNDRYAAGNAYENVATYPKLVTLTTTLRCNYRCWMCYQKEYKGDLDWRIVERLEHVLPFAKTLQMFGGEPLLYGRLSELCALAGKYACELDIITNGSLLDTERRAMLLDNNAALIKVSLEAATQDTYHFIRGGDLAQVLANIRAMADAKAGRGLKNPALQINFVAMERNIRELPDLVPLAAEAGVDKLLILFMNAQDREDLARESLFFHQQLSDECMRKALEVGKEKGLEVVVPGFFNAEEGEEDCVVDQTCHSPWKNCLVAMDGTVQFCCGRTGKTLGNLLERDFDEMWQCGHITTFRKLVNTDKQPQCCRTCRVKARNIHDVGFHIRDAGLAKKLLQERASAP